VLPEHLPQGVAAPAATPATVMKARVESAELRAVEEALAAENGNQTRAARRLGVSRRTLIYKLEKYQLRAKDKER
jgi:DNA-binding NtrC family response regulator